jgi:hypothetical protein
MLLTSDQMLVWSAYCEAVKRRAPDREQRRLWGLLTSTQLVNSGVKKSEQPIARAGTETFE